jgi:alpha-tubulin suppressor-like RCC1 family protein
MRPPSVFQFVFTIAILLGSAFATTAQTQQPTPLSGVNQIAAGNLVTCGLMANATVQCWGYGGSDELGSEVHGIYSASSLPVPITGLSGATETSVGSGQVCAVLSNGTVDCWGTPIYTGGMTTTPTPLGGVSGAISVAVGGGHACALLSGGAVQCWGDEVYGQLGNGVSCPQTADCISVIPVAASGLTGASAIAAGNNHTCALLSNGTAQCWGFNLYGQLGNGTVTTSLPYSFNTPSAVTGLAGAVAIASGEGANHTCALLSNGTVQCWGEDLYGQLGNGTACYQSGCTFSTCPQTPSCTSATPVTVSGVSGATAIAVGAIHSCALLANGTVQCWGDNGGGQLGNGTSGNSNVSPIPVTVSGLSGVIAIAAGAGHTCALLSNKTVECWGDDSSGELGNGIAVSFGNPNISSTPVTVLAGQSGSGPATCNCTLTGNYVNPVAAVDPTNNPQTSPHDKYTVSSVIDNTNQLTSLAVTRNSDGAVVFPTQNLPITTNWGFSPDDDRFVYNFVDVGGLNEVYVYDLASGPPARRLVQASIATSESRIQFSPSGRYFLYTTLVNASTTQLQVYRVQGVATQDLVFQNQFAFSVVPGSGEDNFGAVNWGFSPDNPETSFVYAYLTGQSSFQWNIVNLAANRLVQSQSVTNSSSFWQFDPCGDVIALVTQTSGGSDQIALYDTSTGQALAGSGAIVPSLSITLETTSTGQEVEYSGQIVMLSASTCGQSNTPTGSNVTVTPKDVGSSNSPVDITFSTVTQTGETTVSIGSTGPNPAAPTDFQLGNPPTYYDLSTTASFSGSTTVCINYGGVSFVNETAIRLYHFTNGSWVDVTTSVNTTAKIVCGSTASFSPYALVEPTSPLPGTVTATVGTPQQATINTTFAAALQATVTDTDGNPMSGIVVTFAAPLAGATGTFAGSGSLATATTGTTGAATSPLFTADGLAGSYTITASANGVAPAAFSLTNGSATPMIAWTLSKPITYGTALGASQLDATSSVPGTFLYNPPAATILAAGNQMLSVAFTPTDGTDYTPASATVSINVTPAVLTITANSSSRVYGAANPAFTAWYGGFVNGDSAASLSGALVCATTGTSTSPVGSYPITCSGLSSTNYTISFVPGTLSITSDQLTISANNQSRQYGGANPPFNSVTYSGFVNGDGPASLSGVLSCSTTATASSPAGTYPISCFGLNSTNYTITYVPGQLTITPPPCASSVTASVAVTRSGFSYSPLAKRYAQTLTLTNTAGSTITGPIYVILDNLTSSAALYNTGGSTACAAPTGSPYVSIAGPIGAGANINVMLQFTDPTNAAISYSARFLAGAGQP